MLKIQNSDTPYKGYGASLMPSYAIERAMLECVQYYHMCNKYNWDDQATSLFMDIENENYLQAAKLNVLVLLTKNYLKSWNIRLKKMKLNLIAKIFFTNFI